jgi:hypothetical protein
MLFYKRVSRHALCIHSCTVYVIFPARVKLVHINLGFRVLSFTLRDFWRIIWPTRLLGVTYVAITQKYL